MCAVGAVYAVGRLIGDNEAGLAFSAVRASANGAVFIAGAALIHSLHCKLEETDITFDHLIEKSCYVENVAYRLLCLFGAASDLSEINEVGERCR